MSTQKIEEKIYLNSLNTKNTYFNLSSVDADTAFKMVKYYMLFEYKKQSNLFYSLSLPVTDMYESKSNSVGKDFAKSIPESHKKGRFIPSVKTFEMSQKFMNYIDDSFKYKNQIFIEHKFFEKAFNKGLVPRFKAILVYFMYKNRALSFWNKGELAEFQDEFDGKSSDSRCDLRDNALRVLIDCVKDLQAHKSLLS